MLNRDSSLRRRCATAFVLMLGITFGACAEDSTAPPATSSSAATAPPVVDKHHLTREGKLIGPARVAIPANSKSVTGYVDAATPNGKNIDLNGWAARSDLSGPADMVVAIAGDRSVAVVPSGDRPDVVDGYDQPGLARTGFGMSVPLSALDCSAPKQGLKTYAVSIDARAAAPLTWLSDVGQIIREACRGR